MPRIRADAYTFDQLASIRRCLGPLCFSPDGREIVYVTDTSGQLNLWRAPVEGGISRQITTFVEHSVRAAAWSPDGETIALVADRDGDEFYQIFLVSTAHGEVRQLTSGARTRHRITAGSWSPDGRYLAYDANDRGDHSNTDVLVYDVKLAQSRRLLAGNTWYGFGGWSPDAKHVVAVEFKSTTDQRLHVLTSGARRRRVAGVRGAKMVPGPWAADGSGFYFLTDFGRDFVGLAFHELARDNWRWIARPPWDIEHVTGSADGRYLAWSVNENGLSKLVLRDLGAGHRFEFPGLGVIEDMVFSAANDRLAFVAADATHCAEVFVIDLPRRKVRRVTRSMNPAVDERKLVRPTQLRYRSHDGRQIPAWLYKPAAAGPRNRAPLVVSIHGGPERQERPAYNYSGLYQYLTQRGIAVFAPNIRGSTGYGTFYQKLIQRDWGGAELRDIDSAIRFLSRLPWIDPDRIAIFGGSFGGFAALSAISRLPYRWAAAVDVMGPTNLVTFAKAVPPHWRRLMRQWVGDPERDRDRLLAASPLTYVEQITAPLLIIQGANDPRVARSESDAMAERLQRRGVDVRYEVYPDEGHGFTKRENELKAWRTTAEFLEQHLLPPNA